VSKKRDKVKRAYPESLKSMALELEVPLPRGTKNGDRIRLERRSNVVRRYVNGVRKADWRIPPALR
jgi:hypothetical protein